MNSAPAKGLGWNARDIRVLAACHLGLSATVSPAFIGVYGLFLKPVAEKSGWARADVAAGLSIVTCISIVAVATVGLAVDRWGPRIVTLFAALGLPAAIALVAVGPPSWPLFAVGCAFVGLVSGAASPGPYLSVLSRWFDRRLGLAIAIGVSGLGSGIIINSILLTHLIPLMGWRQSWLVFALYVAILGLAARVLVPWNNLGDRAERPVHGGDDAEVASSISHWRDPRFWTMTAAFTLVLLVTTGVNVNIPAALADRGQTGLTATVVSTVGVASFLARLTGGALLDVISTRRLGAFIFTLQGLGCVMLYWGDSPVTTIAAAFMISFAFGVEADIMPYVVRMRYGVARFGRAYGLMFGGVQVGAVVGPLMVAWGFDRLGSYDRMFLVLAGCSLAAAVLLWFALRSAGLAAEPRGAPATAASQ